MKKLLLLFLFSPFLWATQSDVAQMLEQAKNSFTTQKTVNQEREQIFLKELQAQNELLKKAKSEVQALKSKSIELNNIIDANEKVLSEAEQRLIMRSGNLGELYGIVRQSSADLAAQLTQSATSAQNTERLEFLKGISQTKKLPNAEKLSHFWFIMLQELSLQGFNGTRTLDFIDAEGKIVQESVQTAGVFSAITKDGFANYIPGAQMFATLSKQPSSALTSVAVDGFFAKTPIYETVIDPTRGQLLALFTEEPSFEERIDQGSTIGYIILVLGALGLLYALYLGLKLLRVSLFIKQEKADSFMAEIQNTYDKTQHQSLDHIELAMQERLAFFKQKTHSGLALLKLLAAVAPLLGLLGTVTGMIETFSAITLFGTGDPKLMAGGISQALVTTVEGLIVAIPLLFVHTFLASKASDIMENLNGAALKLLAQHQAK